MSRKMAVLIATVVALAAWTALPAYAAGSWAVQAPANPSSFTLAELDGVWCASASDCIAVGYYENSSYAYVAMAEQSNGSKWTLLSPYSPAGARLNGISCVSASSCEAVGVDSTGDLAEHWNGSAWSAQTISGTTGLNAISCVSASDCEAVGNGAAWLWNGTTWTAQTVSTPPDMTAISCTSASNCVAVGTTSGRDGEGEHWNGSTWSGTSMPAGGVGTGPSSVSCVSATYCLVTATRLTVNYDPLAISFTWNGSTWTATSSSPVNQAETGLYGVSCTSTTSCIAVGDYTPSSGVYDPSAQFWNGSTWAVQTVPSPAGAEESVLYGISCPSAADCSAAGDWNASGAVPRTLAEQYTS
jgi:hypothetical protein